LAQSTIASPEEYEEIISSLIAQRDRLEADLKMLREKVVALQQKQAQKWAKTLKKRPSPLKANLRE
jgi:outer membrane murein-binding lipoprotein Lpp